MNTYTIESEKMMVNAGAGESLETVYSVVHTEDSYPINYGHFLSEADAEYVRTQMETGNWWGDRISDLCKGMDSWINV